METCKFCKKAIILSRNLLTWVQISGDAPTICPGDNAKFFSHAPEKK